MSEKETKSTKDMGHLVSELTKVLMTHMHGDKVTDNDRTAVEKAVEFAANHTKVLGRSRSVGGGCSGSDCTIGCGVGCIVGCAIFGGTTIGFGASAGAVGGAGTSKAIS